MTKSLMFVSLVVLSAFHGHCQDLQKSPAFEVASFTPCKPGTPAPPMEHAGVTQFTSPGGRFNASATTVKVLVEWAYGIQPSQHSGGPSWIDTDRYDIVAKAEGNATDDQMKLMMRTLLMERFKLSFHHESKEMNAYVITVGKASPKLFPPKDGETPDLKLASQTGQDQKFPTYHVVATRISLGQLADIFSRSLGGVVVNDTGLSGEFDFTLDLTPDESRPNPTDPSILMTAMREQLGLVLKSQKTPTDILIIDNVERIAAGN